MTKFALIALVLLPGLLFSQNPWKDVYSEKSWEERDGWQRPDDIISLLKLSETSHVADIGSHEGYFTIKLAKKVKNGIVYAVDIAPGKIEKLKEIAKARALTNVRAILAEPVDPKLPIDALDGILIVDTYHEIEDYALFLKNLRKGLRTEGRLLICEPIAEQRKGMSRKDQFKKHELESKYVLTDLKEAGFEVEFHQEDFVDRVHVKGDKMWIIVARKKK